MSKSLAEPDEIQKNLNPDMLDLFWGFITERHKIWVRRVIERQDAPWTKDKILQQYRFTNVYRQLDPGTQYVIQNILEVDASRRDKLLNVMIYRLIGRQETHEFLGMQTVKSFDPKTFEEQLKHLRDELGGTVFTGAYMVSGYNHMGSSDKVENIASLFEEITSSPTVFEDILSAESLEAAYDAIRSQPGFGNFLSYQVVIDLLYPVEYYNGESILPFSPNEWSAPGPGAQKGIKELVTEFVDFNQVDVMRWLRRNQDDEFCRLGLDFPYLKTGNSDSLDLSLANIQNCLCEFYKYHKILHSNGRARRCFRDDEARSNSDLREIYEEAPNILLT